MLGISRYTMGGVFCAVTDTVNIVGTRPRLLIIQHLNGDVRGFNELKRRTSLSSRTLSKNLAFLQENGIVRQERAEYSLSQKGSTLLPVLAQLGEWGLSNDLLN